MPPMSPQASRQYLRLLDTQINLNARDFQRYSGVLVTWRRVSKRLNTDSATSGLNNGRRHGVSSLSAANEGNVRT